MQAIMTMIREIIHLDTMLAQQLALLMQPEPQIVNNPINLCDLVGSLAQNSETEELQNFMEELNVKFIL